ncbi:hypothetical protein [Nannocystis sp. SCPEA4]|uniref:hypothetical protein n=1 Tax=Nannocystis sp. SCPEA4 TaxID=2996787 RepID=UPI0022713CC6|nr:hypothetical protein [Nannocystis sp. SCPEA4]MCY1055593.1 hypothetical protein [Nannocystis sp. SCPEA4]
MSPALGVLVSAALALGPAPAHLPQRFDDLETLVSDLAAQKSYQALADTAERGFERRDLDPSQRRLMAFFAIRGLHGVYEDTGKVAELCHARRLLRRVERDPGLADDASTAARLGKATAKLLAASGGEEQCVKKAIPAAKPPAPRPAPTPEPTAAENSASTPAAAAPTPQDDLAPVRARPIGHVSSDMSRTPSTEARPEGPPPPAMASAAPPADQDERRPVGRTVGAIASLSVGAAAAGVCTASLFYRSDARDRIAALAASAAARGESTPEEYAEAQRLNHNHRSLTGAAWASGAVALIALVTGAALLAVPPRRTTTAAAPWAGPSGAGLTLRGHF